MNTDAKLEEIETILKGMDQTEARKVLDKERPSRNDIDDLMHKEHAWVVLNPQFDKLLELLKEETQKYGQVKRSPEKYLKKKPKMEKILHHTFYCNLSLKSKGIIIHFE